MGDFSRGARNSSNFFWMSMAWLKKGSARSPSLMMNCTHPFLSSRPTALGRFILRKRSLSGSVFLLRALMRLFTLP